METVLCKIKIINCDIKFVNISYLVRNITDPQ